MKSIKWAFGAGALALSLVISGCANKESASEKQLAETQAKLDEANKKLEAAGVQPVEGATGPGAAGSGGTAPGATTPGGTAPGDTAPRATASPAPPRVPPPPVIHTVPAGTAIAVRTITSLSTKTAANGEPFQATLQQPLLVDGYVVAAKGATVDGVVVNSDPGGKVKGVASITVGLKRIVLADGSPIPISTQSYSELAKSTKGKDATKVGITTGIGAAIGAIAGGGKGAAIGAGAGAAGGTGLVLATKGAPAVIPSETVITFKLAAPFTVTESKQ